MLFVIFAYVALGLVRPRLGFYEHVAMVLLAVGMTAVYFFVGRAM
jgi:hypothetical protein